MLIFCWTKTSDASSTLDTVKQSDFSQLAQIYEGVQTAELVYCLNLIEKHQSYRSCNNMVFPDSKIASSFSCAESKAAYMITFGLSSYLKQVQNKALAQQHNHWMACFKKSSSTFLSATGVVLRWHLSICPVPPVAMLRQVTFWRSWGCPARIFWRKAFCSSQWTGLKWIGAPLAKSKQSFRNKLASNFLMQGHVDCTLCTMPFSLATIQLTGASLVRWRRCTIFSRIA